MTSTSRKIHSRRRLAALTFLSNISLDGTHRDTNLCHLNFNLHCNKTNNHQSIPVQHKENWIGKRTSGSIDTALQRTKNAENAAAARSFECEGKKICRRRSEDKISDTIYHFDEQLSSKGRDRVHKFMNEAKARLCNLSQKRKQLSHQKSFESYGLPSGKSTESLGGCRSRKASLCPSEFSVPIVAEIKFLQSLKDHRNEAERMVLVSQKKSPIVLFSVLPYYRSHSSSKGEYKLEGSRRRHTSSRQLSVIADGPDPLDLLALLGVERPTEGQDISYGELLYPSYFPRRGQSHDGLWADSECPFRFPYQIYTVDHMTRMPLKLSSTPPKNDKFAEREDGLGQCLSTTHSSLYHPNLLDDPELNAGKHSTLLVFPSYITSVIDYVKPSDLKKDLNDKFKERFPHVQLTLSKLRSLKKEMYKIAKVEVLVNKQNRKLCAGACLLLSAKLNDVNRIDLQTLVEKIEMVFRINRKDLMCLEFGILVALEFSLLLSTSEILPHYQRLVYES